MQNVLLTKLVLKLPDLGKEFILRTDASEKGIGAILLQNYDGNLLPVSYSSKKLLGKETRYTISEKECLAIVWD